MKLRWLFAGLVLSTTAVATSRLWDVLRVDGLTGTELLFLLFVTILFFWIATAFWLTAIGAYALWRGREETALNRPAIEDPALRRSSAKTVLLYPIRNEEVGRLMAGVEAVIASVCASGTGDRFDVFFLSDSCGLEHLKSEQDAFFALRARWAGRINIYYRHRALNVGRKSGNIAEFCRNWGSSYDYMVVFDADSLMTAETLIALVQLMDANPRVGLVQVPPLLVGRDSLFARIQQFASSVYGPLYNAGHALLLGGDGNYWGHNAIIRVRPFIENCGLPELPGRAPLGGEIMSHDFVEAALLRRAGWEVHLASHLGGSYEEPPPALIDYLKRDRRWCQGNLQHARLIFARGFRASSRWHFVTGVMSYLSSPLWLGLMITSVVLMLSDTEVRAFSYVGSHPILAWPVSHALEFVMLVSATAVLLFVPKILALLLLLRDPLARRAHGGAFRVVSSVFIEALFSALFAPVMMLSQSGFVGSILLLRKVSGWNVQVRSEQHLAWTGIVRAFLPHTVAGLVAAAFVWFYLPGGIWWTAPFIAGLVLSIPLAALVSSSSGGRVSRRTGLFLVPWEVGAVPLVAHVRNVTDLTSV